MIHHLSCGREKNLEPDQYFNQLPNLYWSFITNRSRFTTNHGKFDLTYWSLEVVKVIEYKDIYYHLHKVSSLFTSVVWYFWSKKDFQKLSKSDKFWTTEENRVIDVWYSSPPFGWNDKRKNLARVVREVIDEHKITMENYFIHA